MTQDTHPHHRHQNENDNDHHELGELAHSIVPLLCSSSPLQKSARSSHYDDDDDGGDDCDDNGGFDDGNGSLLRDSNISTNLLRTSPLMRYELFCQKADGQNRICLSACSRQSSLNSITDINGLSL